MTSKIIYVDILGNELNEGDTLLMNVGSNMSVTKLIRITKGERIVTSCEKKTTTWRHNINYTYTVRQYRLNPGLAGLTEELMKHNGTISRYIYWKPLETEEGTKKYGQTIVNLSKISTREVENFDAIFNTIIPT